MPRFAANLTMMFTELPFLEPLRRGRRGGVRRRRVPVPLRVRQSATSPARSQHNGLTLVLHNLPAGDWAARRARNSMPSRSDRGVSRGRRTRRSTTPLRSTVRRSIALPASCPSGVTADAARATPDREPALCRRQARGRRRSGCSWSRSTAATFRGSSSTAPRPALDIIAATGSNNIKLQYDIYHAQVMEGDLARTIETRVRPHRAHPARRQSRPPRARDRRNQLPVPFPPHRRTRLPRLDRLRIQAARPRRRRASAGFAPYQPKRQARQPARSHSS